MNEEEYRRQSDETMPVLIHRMDALERRVDAGFTHIDHRLDTLSFVRADVYAAEKETQAQEMNGLRDFVTTELAETKRLGAWAIGLVVGLVLTSMVGFLIYLARGGIA